MMMQTNSEWDQRVFKHPASLLLGNRVELLVGAIAIVDLEMHLAMFASVASTNIASQRTPPNGLKDEVASHVVGRSGDYGVLVAWKSFDGGSGFSRPDLAGLG